MFHNVLMTTLTPIRDTNQTSSWDKPYVIKSPEIKQEKSKDTNIKKTIKKRKRNRTMFTTEQKTMLEKLFESSKYIDAEKRRELSECLQIEQKCIKTWFQNRRMKEKKELSENSETTSVSQIPTLESVSSPLDSSQLSNNDYDTGHIHPEAQSELWPSQYYNNYPYNFIKADLNQGVLNNYEASNNTIAPEYLNYDSNHFNSYMLRNNTNYPTQYYSPQTDFHHYYNTGGETNNIIPDWSPNIYNTSYF